MCFKIEEGENMRKEIIYDAPREIKIGKRYRHLKGKEYLVLHIAKHSETLEEMVV